MGPEVQARLDGLTRERIERCASILARRVRLGGDLAGHEAVDFIQEAIRKVLAGERSLEPLRPLEENLVAIAQSLVWNERKKLARAPVREDGPPAAVAEPADPDMVANLHRALVKVQGVLETAAARRRRDDDAWAFLARLLEQIERRESIRPGCIADRLGWRRERAYAAWRRVKTLLHANFKERDG